MDLHNNQQTETDKNGILRFRENKIVSYLLENGGIDLNDIAQLSFPREDRIQFAQLIGYSVSGWGGLSYVIGTDIEETIYKQLESGEDERDIKIKILEERLQAVKQALKTIIPDLFCIHPDDLEGE